MRATGMEIAERTYIKECELGAIMKILAKFKKHKSKIQRTTAF